MNAIASKTSASTAGTRSVLVALAVAWLNLVLQPCAMAIDFEPRPDCPHCPKTLSASGTPERQVPGDISHCGVSVADCLYSDGSTVDGRPGQLKFKDLFGDQPFALMPVPVVTRFRVDLASKDSWHSRQSPGNSPPFTILYCVHLK